MSHFLTVPINENGIITDPQIDTEIQIAAIPPFKFTDVFIYSHGWWNTETDAVCEYNIFSIGFSKTLQELAASGQANCPRFCTAGFNALALGVHWPSMLSENQNSITNFLEATSFFTMEHRADDVGEHGGYSLLRLLIQARQNQPPLRFHLFGHSFGCRVLCSALQTLSEDADTMKIAAQINAEFNVVLLQAAADASSLAPKGLYEDVLQIPNLKMLITTSQNDRALGTWYSAAQRLVNLFSNPVPALGSAGPTGLSSPPAKFTVSTSPISIPAGQVVVADITPVHEADAAAWETAAVGAANMPTSTSPKSTSCFPVSADADIPPPLAPCKIAPNRLLFGTFPRKTPPKHVLSRTEKYKNAPAAGRTHVSRGHPPFAPQRKEPIASRRALPSFHYRSRPQILAAVQFTSASSSAPRTTRSAASRPPETPQATEPQSAGSCRPHPPGKQTDPGCWN